VSFFVSSCSVLKAQVGWAVGSAAAEKYQWVEILGPVGKVTGGCRSWRRPLLHSAALASGKC